MMTTGIIAAWVMHGGQLGKEMKARYCKKLRYEEPQESYARSHPSFV